FARGNRISNREFDVGRNKSGVSAIGDDCQAGSAVSSLSITAHQTLSVSTEIRTGFPRSTISNSATRIRELHCHMNMVESGNRAEGCPINCDSSLEACTKTL